jgi:DNA-binding transcriptional ArsR family regulator
MTGRDPYFAIADATRRSIIDLLWADGAMPAGTIAARFTGMSRVAVSKHLRILLDAGLVHAEPRGRELWYALDLSRLHGLHEAWFSRFAPLFDDSLARLRGIVEADVLPSVAVGGTLTADNQEPPELSGGGFDRDD